MGRESAAESPRGGGSIVEALSRPAEAAWPELEIWRKLDYEAASAVLEELVTASGCLETDILPDYWTARSPLAAERPRPAGDADIFRRDPETGEEFVWSRYGSVTRLASRRVSVGDDRGKQELEAFYYCDPRLDDRPGEPPVRRIRAVSASAAGEGGFSRRKEIEVVNARSLEYPATVVRHTESHELETEVLTGEGRLVCCYRAVKDCPFDRLFDRYLRLRRYERGEAERPLEEIIICDPHDLIGHPEEGKLLLKARRRPPAASDGDGEFLSWKLGRILRSEEATRN